MNRTLKIKTTRARGGFKAFLAEEPKTHAYSNISAYFAARNLAVRLLIGNIHHKQRDPADQEKVVVARTGDGTYLATYEGEVRKEKKGNETRHERAMAGRR